MNVMGGSSSVGSTLEANGLAAMRLGLNQVRTDNYCSTW